MLAHSIAEFSCSSWSSSCLLANKSYSFGHFCTDYRNRNSVSKSPSSTIGGLCEQCWLAAFVIKLDLLKGSWQVALTPQATERSPFLMPEGSLQYTVIPFGVHKAPATSWF